MSWTSILIITRTRWLLSTTINITTFYSYCQGLHHIGRKETIIQNVIVETEDEESGYITQITVMQIEKKK